MRDRLFSRNPAVWSLPFLKLWAALRRARRDDLLIPEGGRVSGLAEISGLP